MAGLLISKFSANALRFIRLWAIRLIICRLVGSEMAWKTSLLASIDISVSICLRNITCKYLLTQILGGIFLE